MLSLIWAVTLVVVGSAPHNQGVQSEPDRLVRELREFPAELPPTVRSDGVADPIEERRSKLYAQLRELGYLAWPALIRGLADTDVRVRRNVALFLAVAASAWSSLARPRMNIEGALPALIVALDDSDDRVRGLAAQGVGEIGPSAAPAVPALIKLLNNASEGSRDSACIGLRGIGPAASSALPALRKALADPSVDVRGFAQRAIDAIDVR